MDPNIQLTQEQKHFIQLCLKGYNVWVEACIGSGKTTAIQELCNRVSQDKRVLYLTYNTLLKMDAKRKIQGRRNLQVTNYHGFAHGELIRQGIRVHPNEQIPRFLAVRPPIRNRIDLMILDEYQDINQDISKMLCYIREENPSMQIVCVGDMDQKISNNTVLDAKQFICSLMDDYVSMEFTNCFRLNAAWASQLSQVWQKEIHGVNPDFEVEYMSFSEALRYLGQCRPQDVLCLGGNHGRRNVMLNELERQYPDCYNKNTVWSKITDDTNGPSSAVDAGIFTTYDGSKGMERPICVLFDWTEAYWQSRIQKPNTKYEILRNIFCVAASRGKKKLIIVEDKDEPLSWDTLMTPPQEVLNLQDVDISSMFKFKQTEPVHEAFEALKTVRLQPPGRIIDIPTTDGLIDVSPCIGVYQEVKFFTGTLIERYVDNWYSNHVNAAVQRPKHYDKLSVDQKILFYMQLSTGQNRYFCQTRCPFVSDVDSERIMKRLSTHLSPDDLTQMPCDVYFYDHDILIFRANGLCDVLDENNVVWELKFVESLSEEHFLQCAMYMIARCLSRGILWNVKSDEMYEIRIPDRQKFMNLVLRAVTMGQMDTYETDELALFARFARQNEKLCGEALDAIEAGKLKTANIVRWFSRQGFVLPCTGKQFVDYMGDIGNMVSAVDGRGRPTVGNRRRNQKRMKKD